MQIGEVIRTYRKKQNLTQEEMAGRLGVTAPAVNKWENGNSYPDILLLAPIARLLGISLDTLLSFQEELTAEEIGEMVCQLDRMLKEKPYEEVFRQAKKNLARYPNCGQLLWQTAVILDAQKAIQGRESEEEDRYLQSLYRRVLECGDEKLRSLAAGSLFGFYMRKEQYGEAEECLAYVSEQDPVRKGLQARLYSATGRTEEAYKAYEELLFSCYPIVSAALQGMSALALRQNDRERARRLAAKQEEMAVCFEMGPYYEAAGWLEPAMREKDVEKTRETMQKLLDGIEELGLCRSPLYEHMTFRKIEGSFYEELKEMLKKSFDEEERYGFLRDCGEKETSCAVQDMKADCDGDEFSDTL